LRRSGEIVSSVMFQAMCVGHLLGCLYMPGSQITLSQQYFMLNIIGDLPPPFTLMGMKRREFLKQSAFTTAGTMMISSFLKAYELGQMNVDPTGSKVLLRRRGLRATQGDRSRRYA
jgi:hypothetical protein